MNKTLKKTLSIILTILMIVTSVPFAFAADGHTHALTADGEVLEFATLPADTTSIYTAGNYYLTQDMELTDNLWIDVEGTVNLCLNGHSITAVEDGSNQTVVLLAGGTLNLCDCKGGGCITSAEDLTFSGVMTLGDTEFNMYSGEIKNNYYYAVDCVDFNMYGGKLSGNKLGAVDTTGTFNMYGGEISGNSSDRAGSAVCVSNGSFTMYGGEIKNNENTSVHGNSGAVYVQDGTFTMKDGKISGNTASAGSAVYVGNSFVMDGGEISDNTGYTGGVSAGYGATFTMNDGIIKNNSASGRGGGVYLDERASFNMNGGEISGNTATQGGGIFTTYASAVVNLKKGLITNNTATEYAGGVGSQYANTPVEISGADVQVMNNTAPTYPNLRVNDPLIVSAALDSAKTKIYLTVNNDIIAKPDGTNLTTLSGMNGCFVDDSGEYDVFCNTDGELYFGSFEARVIEKDGDLVLVSNITEGVTYQWYEVDEETLTAISGETSATLDGEKLVVGKTYACKVYLDGEEVKTLTIKYSYKITHQPTVAEPYVETNDEDATYQWYTVEYGTIEITDKNGEAYSYGDETATYDNESGWTSIYDEDGYYSSVTIELNAGDTVILEFEESGFEYVGLWDFENSYECAYAEEENGVTKYELTADSYGNYTVYTEAPINFKIYLGEAATYTKIEGETSAKLENPEIGKKYACEVTFVDGTKEKTAAFEYVYAITHQPTVAEPYVELNDDTDASYQWYTVEGGKTEITDENATAFDPDTTGIPAELFDTQASYSASTGWIPATISFSEGVAQYYFTIELKAGEKINFEFSSAPETVMFAPIESDSPNTLTLDGKKASFTATEDGNYCLVAMGSSIITAKASMGDVSYTELEGQTSATLTPTALGKYACEVTFADDTTEMSKVVEITTLHTCDFDGDWKYDSEKHWKECAVDNCDKTAEEAVHAFEKGECTVCYYVCPHESYTDGVCDNCEYECLHDWNEGALTRPTATEKGYYTYTCELCGDTYTEEVESADCSACNDLLTKVINYSLDETLTQEATTEIYQSYQNFINNNSEIIDNFGFIRDDLIASEQGIVNEATAELQGIVDAIEAKIASGEYVKADYTGIDEAIKAIDEALENATINDEMTAEFEDIKADLEALKADANISAADLANSGLLARAEAIAETMANCANGVHAFTKYEETEAPKCGVAGKKVASCDHGCGATDEGEITALEHSFVDYKSNGDATCEADGTKTAECIHNCGETDTVADEGSKLDHTDEDGDKVCDDCEAEIIDVCPDCGRPVHDNSFVQNLVCFIIMFINLVKSAF